MGGYHITQADKSTCVEFTKLHQFLKISSACGGKMNKLKKKTFLIINRKALVPDSKNLIEGLTY
jgi:hypothetical protein